MAMKKAAFHNLGCKVNYYETEAMLQSLEENGYQIVDFEDKADIYIVNTCSVTNMADRKSRQMLHKAKKNNPEAVVVAVGCYVQAVGEQILKDNGVDIAIGNDQKGELSEILRKYFDENGEAFMVEDLKRPRCYENISIVREDNHTRAYIKVQDGCNQFCTYCIIPYARGRVRSRREEDIIREIEGLVASGYQEIVLTGIHISSYGIDFAGKKSYQGENYLIDLVEHIHARVEGLKRIRLGSLEPRIITEDVAKRLAALPKLCPHFHLSLQSGCDETLKRMNRHYTTGEYLQGVRYLRQAFKRVAITTDVIVGFPGETEAEFEDTLRLVEQVGFDALFTFIYSPREGTPAATMPDPFTRAEKQKWFDRLLEAQNRISQEKHNAYVGRTLRVLVDGADGEFLTARTD